MKKIVVTGATSMVGIALIETCISRDVEVLALVREGSTKRNRLPVSDKIHIVECELSKLDTISLQEKEYDVFYHLGWTNTAKEYRNCPEKQQENIKISLDAIRLAKQLGCKKFVGAGSQAEYGIHMENKTKPDSPLSPVTAYGISKMTAGKLCSIEAKNLGLDFSWIRIFSLYGKYELPNTLIQTVLPKLLRNEKCSFTKATQQWDYLYGADAGEAFFLVGENAVGNNFYCLGSGQGKPLKEYILQMKEFVKSQSVLGFGDISCKEEELIGMCADITKLKEDVGWSPKIDFLEGILEMLSIMEGSCLIGR